MHTTDVIQLNVLDTNGNYVSQTLEPHLMEILTGQLHSIMVSVNSIEILRANICIVLVGDK